MSRSNQFYIDLLKEYNMDQKISPLEKWLLSVRKEDEYFTDDKFPNTQEIFDEEKKVSNYSVSSKPKFKNEIRHTHFIIDKNEMFVNQIKGTTRHLPKIHISFDFKSEWTNAAEINDKISQYLRWKIDKWRIDTMKVNCFTSKNLNILWLENTSYGIQKTEQEFIIWKYKNKRKWIPLAEYNYKFNIAKTYQSFLRRNKRRRKIDIIINLLIYFMGNNFMI
jgi:hypothetical protein